MIIRFIPYHEDVNPFFTFQSPENDFFCCCGKFPHFMSFKS